MDLASDVKKYLTTKYNDPKFPGSFAGVDKFYRSVRKDGKYSVSRKRIAKFLQSQDPYTLLRKVNRKFPRNRLITPYKDYLIDANTAHLISYAKRNDGIAYLVAGIDTFTKEAYAVPVKSLKAIDFIPAMEKLFSNFDKVERCRSDSGSEFKSKRAQNFFKERGIKHYVTNNEDFLANTIERFFRTLKTKLYKYMLENNTHRWIDQLDAVVSSYNNTYHSSIKMAPTDYSEDKEFQVWKTLYEWNNLPKPKITFKFNLHDKVRISLSKDQFGREFDEKWSREYFFVAARNLKDKTPVYRIKDINNELLTGSFYEKELQIIDQDEDQVYVIEKVLKKSRNRSLVKWLGWSEPTWVNNSDLINLQQ